MAIEQPALPEGLARRIRYVREFMRGWTQARLSQETAALGRGIPIHTLKRIESGERMPTFAEIWVIARALNVKIRALGATEEDYPELAFLADPEMLKHTTGNVRPRPDQGRLQLVPR